MGDENDRDWGEKERGLTIVLKFPCMAAVSCIAISGMKCLGNIRSK